MSGIAGFVNLDGAPVDRTRFAGMMQAIAFRGPDAQNSWIGETACLGHTLLRTTDESADEHQPWTLDGSTWIVADARIDGRPELIAALKSNGHEISPGAPDVELVLHAWEVWQEGCLSCSPGPYEGR